MHLRMRLGIGSCWRHDVRRQVPILVGDCFSPSSVPPPMTAEAVIATREYFRHTRVVPPLMYQTGLGQWRRKSFVFLVGHYSSFFRSPGSLLPGRHWHGYDLFLQRVSQTKQGIRIRREFSGEMVGRSAPQKVDELQRPTQTDRLDRA